jgi:hypothetical protein
MHSIRTSNLKKAFELRFKQIILTRKNPDTPRLSCRSISLLLACQGLNRTFVRISPGIIFCNLFVRKRRNSTSLLMKNKMGLKANLFGWREISLFTTGNKLLGKCISTRNGKRGITLRQKSKANTCAIIITSPCFSCPQTISMHGAIRARPIGLSNGFLVDLGCGCFRDLAPELDGFWRFHATQASLAVRYDFFLI